MLLKWTGLTLTLCTFLYAIISVIILSLHNDRLQSTFHDKYAQKECSENFCVSEECLRNGSEVVSDRWIVITTKHYKSDVFKKLAALHGWQIVVVSDNNASLNWHAEAVHLVRFNQSHLAGSTHFEITRSIPQHSYSRKNIGYLYAIKNGAKFIYDAEESIVLDGNGLIVFDYDAMSSGLWYYASNETKLTSERTFNPYQFFGCTKTPTEIAAHFKGHTNAEDRLRLCRRRLTPPVQHGLIRREFQSNSDIKMDSCDEFNKFAPQVSLAPGVFSMLSSSNTLFHYRAFFALFVPVSVTSRNRMVLRSYYIQKLLHLIGDGIGFYPPSAKLPNNGNNFKSEFVEEGENSPTAYEMADFLKWWECNDTHITACMISLAKEFRRRNFWSEADVIAVAAWINDLKQLRWVQSHSNLEAAINKTDAFKALSEWCSESGHETKCNYPHPSQLALVHANHSTLTNNQESVLVIINNYQRKRGIGLLQRLYQPYFGLAIFCGTWSRLEHVDDGLYPGMVQPFNYIHVSGAELVRGVFMYYCLAKVQELRLRNVRGYFITADDAIFNFWNELDHDEIQYPVWVIEQRYPSAWWRTVYGYEAAQRAKRLFTKTYQNDTKIKELFSCYQKGLLTQGHFQDAASHLQDDNGWTLSDFFYVPQKRLVYLSEAMELFFEAELFVELTMNKLLQTVPHIRIPHNKFAYIPQALRDQWKDYYRPDLVMVHPIKLNYFADLTMRRAFCDTVVRSFGKTLLQCSP